MSAPEFTAASRQSSEPATTTPCSATAPRKRSAPVTSRTIGRSGEPSSSGPSSATSPSHGDEAAAGSDDAGDRCGAARRRSRPASLPAARSMPPRSMPNQRAKNRSPASAASCVSPAATEPSSGEPAGALRRRALPATLPPAWMARPPEAASRLCAPSAPAPASRLPPTVSAATGAARSPATRPSATSTPGSRLVGGVRGRGAGRTAAGAAGGDRADDAGPRAVGELEREAGRGRGCLPGSATTAAPLAGQRHDQPLSPRTHAACSGTGVPASSQVAATKPAPSSRR